MIEFIDASVFLGMHSPNEKIRIACKNFFVKRLNQSVTMSLEQVGKCDDVIWSCFTDEEQAEYYPFMDRLHTMMKIKRIPYSNNDVQVSLSEFNLACLPLFGKLTLGMAMSKEGILYTVDPTLLVGDLPVKLLVGDDEELSFPEELEKHYQRSLKVRI
ncbi:MAG: DUF6190 family protein [archaeon]|nr:hypothetical protein [Nanoarchaeota archaeon]